LKKKAQHPARNNFTGAVSSLCDSEQHTKLVGGGVVTPYALTLDWTEPEFRGANPATVF
jgi:hypothetical protein